MSAIWFQIIVVFSEAGKILNLDKMNELSTENGNEGSPVGYNSINKQIETAYCRDKRPT